MGLFVLYYLLQSKAAEPSGNWVSEKDIPGGEGFFRGPHLVPVHMIVDRVDNDLETFKLICQALGGRPLDMADAAFAFSVTENIPVAVLFWQGDDDFPAEAKLLFDRTIGLQLPLDILWGAGFCCLPESGGSRQRRLNYYCRSGWSAAAMNLQTGVVIGGK